MKSLDLNLIESRRNYFFWWIAALAIIGGFASIFTGRLDSVESEVNDLSRRLAADRASLSRSGKVATELQTGGALDADKAIGLLQVDLEKCFSTLEKEHEKGVLLKSFRLNPELKLMEMDYYLESIKLVSIVSASLNSGYMSSPWHLQKMNRMDLGASNNFSALSASGAVQATWSSFIEDL